MERKVCLYLLERYIDMNNEKIVVYFAIGYTAAGQAAFRIKREMRENQRVNRIAGQLEIKLLNEE